MGTYYSIKYVPVVIHLHKASYKQNDRILEEVNDQMSTYRPQSELSRFNQSREINTPFPVSPTAKMLVKRYVLIKLRMGLLDVTVGPLVNLWGFAQKDVFTHQPSADELAKRKNGRELICSGKVIH